LRKARATELQAKEFISNHKQAWGSLGINKSVGGGALTVDGKTYKKGFGTHAKSIIQLKIPNGAIKFTAQVGLTPQDVADLSAFLNEPLSTNKPPASKVGKIS
jgi:hypothetical protein